MAHWVQGFGIGIKVLGVGWGLGLRGVKGWGLGLRVQRVEVLRFRVEVLGSRVQGC